MAGEFGYLKSLTDSSGDLIPVIKKLTRIGRSPECEIPLLGNTYVSNRHCCIEVDENNVVWLCDTSLNGTWIKGKGKVHKEKIKLENKTEFFLVFQKTNKKMNVGYVFQEIADPGLDTTVELTSANEDDPGSSKCLTDRNGTDEEKGSPISESFSTSKNCDGLVADDKMEESLMCIICQEIFHGCVSLLPCMHSFCGGCYAEWMEKSCCCPSCRATVEKVNVNRLVNDLVEAYLSTHPEKKRPEEELKLLDEKSRKLCEFDKSKNVDSLPSLFSADDDDNDDDDDTYEADYDEYDDNEDEDDDDDDDNDDEHSDEYYMDDDAGDNITIHDYYDSDDDDDDYYDERLVTRKRNLSRTDISDDNDDARGNDSDSNGPHPSKRRRYTKTRRGQQATTCRQCWPRCAEGTSGEGSSGHIHFACSYNQEHILCQCCLEPMPLHGDEHHFPPQKCGVCGQAFCHMYWGCKKLSCLGCIGLFKGFNFPESLLDTILLENAFESQLLKNYLESKNINSLQFIMDCINKCFLKELSCPDEEVIVNRNMPVCRNCANKNLGELIYNHMLRMPKEDFKAFSRNRPDCYWGRNCRTQRSKLSHAEKYNHVCLQKRF